MQKLYVCVDGGLEQQLESVKLKELFSAGPITGPLWSRAANCTVGLSGPACFTSLHLHIFLSSPDDLYKGVWLNNSISLNRVLSAEVFNLLGFQHGFLNLMKL